MTPVEEVFLDANVILRHLSVDQPELSARATAYLERIAAGEIRARIAPTVVFETVFTLQRVYRRPKQWTRDTVTRILRLPSLICDEKPSLLRAFDYYVSLNMDFGDAYHVAEAERFGLSTIVSFDRGFDRVPGLTRIEP